MRPMRWRLCSPAASRRRNSAFIPSPSPTEGALFERWPAHRPYSNGQTPRGDHYYQWVRVAPDVVPACPNITHHTREEPQLWPVMPGRFPDGKTAPLGQLYLTSMAYSLPPPRCT